jgi:hypothetical protein
MSHEEARLGSMRKKTGLRRKEQRKVNDPGGKVRDQEE